MFKKLSIIFILLFVLICFVFAATTPQILKSKTVTAADQFTTSETFKGRFNLSVSGSSWSATVTLQRSYDNTTWRDVETFTSNIETVVNEPSIRGAWYKIGVKSGDFTSGVIKVELWQ